MVWFVKKQLTRDGFTPSEAIYTVTVFLLNVDIVLTSGDSRASRTMFLLPNKPIYGLLQPDIAGLGSEKRLRPRFICFWATRTASAEVFLWEFPHETPAGIFNLPAYVASQTGDELLIERAPFIGELPGQVFYDAEISPDKVFGEALLCERGDGTRNLLHPRGTWRHAIGTNRNR